MRRMGKHLILGAVFVLAAAAMPSWADDQAAVAPILDQKTEDAEVAAIEKEADAQKEAQTKPDSQTAGSSDAAQAILAAEIKPPAAEINVPAPSVAPVAPAATASTAPVAAAAPKDHRSESEIPVLTAVRTKKVEGTDSLHRLVLSFAIVAAVAVGLLMFMRLWARRRSGLKQHTQIKVLTQYPLGPKKSLAIIRVAGESILIGITDHNISMIKELSLLDEEVPEEVPARFEVPLKGAPAAAVTRTVAANQPAVEEEEFSFGSVKDIVATKLREMRSL